MTEPTQTTPSPIAVPWTPEMASTPSTPHMQAPAAPIQTPSQPQPQAYAPDPVHANPAHPTHQAQSPSQAQPMPQAYQAQQSAQLHAPKPVSNPAPAPAPVAAYPAQTHPAANPGHMQPSVQQPPALQSQRAHQPIPPHHAQTPQPLRPQQNYQLQQQTAQQHQHAPQPYAAHTTSQPPIAQQAPQTLHVGPPPHAPQAHSHMQATQMPAGYEDQAESKSLLAGLLKRSPRPEAVATDMPAVPRDRESLFNKNFMLGGLTGLVIGAFVLPIVIGMFGSDAPQSQARNVTQSSAAVTPPSTAEGSSFIDDAIASDAP